MSKLDDAFQVTPIEDAAEHVRDSVHINGADLRTELERIPADLAHYGFEFARAHRRMLSTKLHADEVKAAVYLEQRETLLDLGSKVTESAIDAHVVTDHRMQAARATLVEAEFDREQMRAVVEALRAKRESLTSLVLLARAEMAGSQGFRAPAEAES